MLRAFIFHILSLLLLYYSKKDEVKI